MGEPLSRRDLLTAGAAGAAGALAAAVPAPARRTTRREADVAVVGAGLAGLAAATRLVRAGADVVVIEARDRVGGRVLNFPIGNGDVIEVGGQWVGPTQDAVLALIDELELKTFPTYNEGDHVAYQNGLRYTYPSDVPIPPGDPAAAADAAQTIVRLNQMASEVPRRRPWRAPSAPDWDSQTMETWIRDNVASPGGRALVRLAIEAVFACEPADTSLLHVLFYIASAGSLELLISTEGGAQERRVRGGSQRIATRLARRLGDRVVLGRPVHAISQERRGVRLRGPGLDVFARRAIVAVPPTLAGRIAYDPPLPGLRDQLTQRVPMGSVIKVQCLYDEPFWRSNGLTGQTISDTGPVKVTFDNSPPDGSPGVLLGFIEGDDARALGRAERRERRDAVVDSFARYFGERARRIEGYVEWSWADEPWTRGCYTGYMPTGVWTAFGQALRRPVGRIHWAGTETASVWNGYMDGAVRSGYAAADQVLRRL